MSNPTRIPSPTKTNATTPATRLPVARPATAAAVTDAATGQSEQRLRVKQLAHPGHRAGHARSASTVDARQHVVESNSHTVTKEKPGSTSRDHGKPTRGTQAPKANTQPPNTRAVDKSLPANDSSLVAHLSAPHRARIESNKQITDASAKRPEFNNFKQHFSPTKLKPPKPAVHISSLSEIRPGALEHSDLSQCFIPLGDELFQLSVLHQLSIKSGAQYSRSTSEHLKSRLMAVEAQEHQLQILEQERQSGINIQAMVGMMRDAPDASGSVINRPLLLAKCVQDVEEICKEGGLFQETLRQFQAWHQMTVSAVNSWTDLKNEELHFVSPLDAHCSTLMQIVQRRMSLCLAALGQIGSVDARSTVAALIEALSAHIQKVQQELTLYKGAEDILLLQQQDWIARLTAEAISEAKAKSMKGEENRTGRGVWEVG